MNDQDDSGFRRRLAKAKPTSRAVDRPIKVYVDATERAELERRAELAGLPVSTFLRKVGLSQPIHSVLDYECVMALAKVNADIGRLGGLLKLWLTDRRGQGATVADVNKVLTEIRDLIQQGRELMGRA